MFDFDNLHEALNNAGLNDLDISHLTFDSFMDILSSSGIDFSHVTQHDLETFLSSFNSVGQTLHFGQNVEFEDGTHITNPYTDAQGYVYKTKDDWLHGTNKNTLE